MTNSRAVEAGESFFALVSRSNMSAAELVVYDLQIERDALVRRANEYTLPNDPIEMLPDVERHQDRRSPIQADGV